MDENKAASNIDKHGIAFETAAEALVDPFVEYFQADASDEARLAAVGETFHETLLYVVHFEREDRVL